MGTRMGDNPQKWLNEECERIRARRDLTLEGKTARIGKAYLEAQETAEKARKTELGEWESRKQQLMRPLIAPKNHSAEWRTLRDNAARDITTASKAAKAMDRALLAGDELEARAIGAVAIERVVSGMPGIDTWVSVLNSWGQSNSSVDISLTQLSEHMNSQPTPTAARMIAGSVLKPAEIERDHRWRQKLNDAPEHHQRPEPSWAPFAPVRGAVPPTTG